MLIQLIRHGSRNPIFKIKNIHTDKSSMAYITTVGMRSSFLLGAAVRKKYNEFFDRLETPRAMYAKASSKERTMMTGAAFFYGLSYRNKKQVLNDNDDSTFKPPIKDYNVDYGHLSDAALPYNFYPLPISTYYRNNMYLNGLHNCPKSGKSVHLFTNEYSETIIKYLQPTIRYLESLGYTAEETFNTTTMNFRQLSYLCDTLIAKMWTQSPKQPIDNTLKRHCEYVLAISLFIVYQNDKLAEDVRLPLYMLFKDVINSYNQIKTPMYAPVFAHDNTIASFFSFSRKNFDCIFQAYKRELVEGGSKVDDPGCITNVPYNANITVEVFSKRNSDKLYVEGLYNGTKYDLCNTKGDCTLEYFMDMLKTKSSKYDYNYVCGTEVVEHLNHKPAFKLLIAVVLSSTVGLLMVVYLFNITKRKQDKNITKEFESKTEVV